MDKRICSEIFKTTLKKWGVEAQYDQTIEECAELITALKHLKRGRITEAEVVEELADVILMVHQLTFMLGEDRVCKAIDKKIYKLKELLKMP
jgi:NTP pyrophosphatase (non-canonical NTP hydrolase)